MRDDTERDERLKLQEAKAEMGLSSSPSSPPRTPRPFAAESEPNNTHKNNPSPLKYNENLSERSLSDDASSPPLPLSSLTTESLARMNKKDSWFSGGIFTLQWLYHHYCSMGATLVSLTWEEFILQWAMMQGVAMLLQNGYLHQRLYTRIALGKAKRMDVVWGETTGVDGLLWILQRICKWKHMCGGTKMELLLQKKK